MSFWQLLGEEFKVLLGERSVLLTMVGGLLLYSFLYPQPFLNQVVIDIPIVVADLDNSATSRLLIRRADASPKVIMQQVVSSVMQAETLLAQGKVLGMLVIPADFEKNLLRGMSPNLLLAGDASYFLVYAGVIEALSGANASLAGQTRVTQLLLNGVPIPTALEQVQPIRLQTVALFNPASGYANYIVPAAFVLILHQTLLIAIGVHSMVIRERQLAGEQGYWQKVPVWKVLCARATLYLLYYIVGACYYFGLAFEFYNITYHANPWVLMGLIVLLLWAALCFAITLSGFLRYRESITQLVLISSIPLIFSAGIIWPVEAIPDWIAWGVKLVPVVPGMDLMIKVNQMEASLSEVTESLTILAGLAIVYTISACWAIAGGLRQHSKV